MKLKQNKKVQSHKKQTLEAYQTWWKKNKSFPKQKTWNFFPKQKTRNFNAKRPKLTFDYISWKKVSW